MFETRSAYVVDGVINAYFYQIKGDKNFAGTTIKTTTTAVELSKYFSKYEEDITSIGFQSGNVDDTNKSADQLFTTLKGTNFNTTIDLLDDFADGKVPTGYGKVVTINVKKDNYLGWKYQAEGADTYSFKIRLLSPIYEGSVVPVEGNAITINGNDLINGADITDKNITGKDYNGNAYNVVADKYVNGTDVAWSNPQIQSVSVAPDKDKYIKTITMTPATQVEGQTVNGTINVKGESISNTVSVEIPVTVKDAWGYELTENVPVTIVKN